MTLRLVTDSEATWHTALHACETLIAGALTGGLLDDDTADSRRLTARLRVSAELAQIARTSPAGVPPRDSLSALVESRGGIYGGGL